MRYPKHTLPLNKFVWYKDRFFWKVKQQVAFGGHTINGKKILVTKRYVIVGTYLLEWFALRKIKSIAAPDSVIQRGADRKLS